MAGAKKIWPPSKTTTVINAILYCMLHIVFNVLQILTHINFNHQLAETIDLHTDRNISIRRWNCINRTKLKSHVHVHNVNATVTFIV